MKNWYKAFFLASLFYVLAIILFFYAELPKPKETLHTPLNLSLYEETVEEEDLYLPPQPKVEPKKEPPKETKTQKKEPEKSQNIARENVKQKEEKKAENDLNVSVAKIEESKLKKDVFMPSMSQINRVFERKEPKNRISKEITDLYGGMAHSMSPRQLEYLDENLNSIGEITQKYLEFPAAAGQLGMFGYTILEFDLYPNGDISDVMLLKSSGYAILDKNSRDTVIEAYKEYPRPKEITKIRLVVKYINSYR